MKTHDICGHGSPDGNYQFLRAGGVALKNVLRSGLFVALLMGCKSAQAGPPPAPSAAPHASSEAPLSKSESAVAPEVNPPGDIPDSQAFVKYRSAAGGYELE